MRTKTLILTAALGTVGAATAMAQVYSVNAVGYINVEVKPGFTMVANQLNTGNNTIAEVVGESAPIGTIFYKYDGSAYAANTWLGFWDDPNMTFAPGEGMFVRTPAAGEGSEGFTLTLVGEVPQGTLDTAVPVGFMILSSQVPQEGGLETVLGYTPTVGDVVYRFDADAQAYMQPSTYLTFWDPVEPTPAVGEAMFINSVDAKTWTREFSVND